MSPRLIPVAHSDYPLLFEIYVSSRAEEMKLAPWTEEQKHAFLESQFEAQSNHYYSTYPNGSFDLIKLEDQTAGRLYKVELDDEIRIIDITLLPQFRNRGIGTHLLSEILETGKTKQKPVSIYIETYNPSQTLLTRLGFIPVADDGVYCLWEKTPEEKNRTSEGLEVSVVSKTG